MFGRSTHAEVWLLSTVGLVYKVARVIAVPKPNLISCVLFGAPSRDCLCLGVYVWQDRLPTLKSACAEMLRTLRDARES